MTAEKFIPNPFSIEAGGRLYKTGDLARYLPDGNIEFLGRIDHQVKLRGFRIEAGEIESTLKQNSSVQEAVVIVREDIPGDKRLVAYVTSSNGSIPSTHELRGFLRRTLPDYMIPSAFVILEALPLTPNGKVDRKALPAPNQIDFDSSSDFVAPRTEVEEKMVRIWAEILGLEQVSIHDDFFDLGGHSLLATQVVFRLIETFHIKVPLRSLFETPTIAGLAKYIETISRMLDEQISPDTEMGNREEFVL